MAKHGEPAEEKPKKLSTYTIKLDDAQMEKLRALCAARQWEPFEVPYARFAFRGGNVNVTAYDKRKVVVTAVKGTADFELRKQGYLTLASCRRWKVAQAGVAPLQELADAAAKADARNAL